VREYKDAQHIDKQDIYFLPVDVLVPGARPYVIDENNANRVQAKVISSIANIPITDEAEKMARELIGTEIKGNKVEKVLVVEKVDIKNEYYVGVIVDTSREVGGPVVMFSTAGGVDIEQAARESPEKVVRLNVDYLRGIRSYDAYELLLKVGVTDQPPGVAFQFRTTRFEISNDVSLLT
jgi:hypothetical protein